MHSKISLKNLKIVFAIFVFQACFSSAFAQSSYQALNDNECYKITNQNLKNGLPECNGLDDLYIFTTDNLSIASKDNAKFTSEIKAIQDVRSCWYDLTTKQVFVSFPKPNNKLFYNNDPRLASLKEVLYRYTTQIKDYKIVIIKSK